MFFHVAFASVFLSVMVFLIKKARGILPGGVNSDPIKQMEALKRYKEWKFISRLNQYSGNKSTLKEIPVLSLFFFHKVLKRKLIFNTMVEVCIFYHGMNLLLIYMLGYYTGNWGVSLAVTLLYSTSYWPIQIIFDGGYQIVATTFFLLGVHSFMYSSHLGSGIMDLSYAFSGFLFSMMIFSSASARKFIYSYLVFFIFIQREQLNPIWNRIDGNINNIDKSLIIAIVFLILTISTFILFFNKYFEVVVTKIYQGNAPQFIDNNFMKSRNKFSLESFLKRKENIKRVVLYPFVCCLVYCISTFLLSNDFSFYFDHLVFMTGVISLFLIISFPDPIKYGRKFYNFWTISIWGDRFKLYEDYLKKRGVQYHPGFRGPALKWYVRFYKLIIPEISVVFIVCVFVEGWLFIVAPKIYDSGIILLQILLFLCPMIYSEATKHVHFSRAYFPTLMGFLFFIYFTSLKAFAFWGVNSTTLNYVVIFLLAYQVYRFGKQDKVIISPRMATSYLQLFLKEHEVKDVYTYRTQFNDGFFDIIKHFSGLNLRVNYISSIKDVDTGFIIIPPTSHKSKLVEGGEASISGIDFDEDEVLNELLSSKKIETISEQKIPTVGCSRIWNNDGEVFSFLDLILNDISPEDYWRGNGWILVKGQDGNFIKLGSS